MSNNKETDISSGKLSCRHSDSVSLGASFIFAVASVIKKNKKRKETLKKIESMQSDVTEAQQCRQ